MKIVRFLSFALVFLFVFNVMQQAYAFRDHCPRHNTKTTAKRKLHKLKVYRGSVAGINEYLLGHSHGPVLAFVEYTDFLSADFDFKYEVVELGFNKYCVRMTHAKGYFIRSPRMVLPTDYKKGSCEYKEILKHEKRHVNALKVFHREFSPRFEAHLGRVARGLPVPNPVARDSIDLVKDQLQEFYLTEFSDFFYKAFEILDKRQSKIDSPQEYRGVARRCNNW